MLTDNTENFIHQVFETLKRATFLNIINVLQYINVNADLYYILLTGYPDLSNSTWICPFLCRPSK